MKDAPTGYPRYEVSPSPRLTGYDALLNGKLTHISGPMVWINPPARPEPPQGYEMRITPATDWWTREPDPAVRWGSAESERIAAAGRSPWNPAGGPGGMYPTPAPSIADAKAFDAVNNRFMRRSLGLPTYEPVGPDFMWDENGARLPSDRL